MAGSNIIDKLGRNCKYVQQQIQHQQLCVKLYDQDQTFVNILSSTHKKNGWQNSFF